MDNADATDRETVGSATAAQMLRVHRRTIVRWCQNGHISRAIRPGHAWEIPLDAIRALLTPPGGRDAP